ncbi:NDP-sugar pyrophosphorylase family protein [Breznakia sp. PF5-3]|uniref:nucleotidyltransferase family protein n=1 Tax=unclassified Breznakia TaxID=2623764 RepID=UPI0024058B24|nr:MULTISPECIES: sugar phosphate nucleotidyltransferase [unclassified Breznakia]MDF9824060.1 NDP-sugar pyrophosphorylase family protein [Breznakia sp. PM6-1]MDF9834874.1 NDP-sugar pyrophosphorylase family protein [Breznakia sp. PF5-3]MDF9837104.1 NDP-sugar pyrophosphorylase family protein [Breznakia sp. PFB2-8]MDF9859029.1 NDP-sugar pyrophosphorylase family protein [Breznakia sp. PH5-24]
MKKTSLVVLAAGMGSRYGGLKQIDKIGPNGEVILELSVYDAIQAGFNEVIFIIKKAIEADFKSAIGDKISKQVNVKYVYQEIDNSIPQGFEIPEGREKPWGTGHALLCCEGVIDSPFAVINADDYYGREGFEKLHDFLVSDAIGDHYAMVGYILANTVSENGSVARGVCTVKDGKLTNVDELTRIEKHPKGIEYSKDEGMTWLPLEENRLVSMNMWGFKPSFIQYMKEDFVKFFENEVPKNQLKSEFYIPKEVGKMLRDNQIEVTVLSSEDKWYGVTYQEDKPIVKAGIKRLIDDGKYPVPLWD